MSQVRLLTVTLIMVSVWALHPTMLQQNIMFIPASTDEIKIRPVGQADLVSLTFSFVQTARA